MTYKEVQDKIFNIFYEVLGETVNPSTLLINDLGVDSLDLIEIIMGIEKEFHIEIPDAEVNSHEFNPNAFCISDVVNYVINKIGGVSDKESKNSNVRVVVNLVTEYNVLISERYNIYNLIDKYGKDSTLEDILNKLEENIERKKTILKSIV